MSTDDKTTTLDWNKHIRLRPGMYVGKRGNGSEADDGLYVLVKEIIDNSVDEFREGFGREVTVGLNGNQLTIRDFGRGIDFDRLVNFNQKLVNVNDKNGMFNRSVGRCGFGIAIVNALSSDMIITSYQKGYVKSIITSRGKIISIDETQPTNEPDGLCVSFTPDNEIFIDYAINANYLREMLKVYAVCNPGLRLGFGQESFYAPQGMLDLLESSLGSTHNSKAIHIVDKYCDLAIAPISNDGKPSIKSFVNGHPTTLGGSHIWSLVDAFYIGMKKLIPQRFLKCDVPANLIICFNIIIENPQFDSCTKSKLASRDMSEDGKTIKQYLLELFEANLPKYFGKDEEIATAFINKLTKN